MLTSNRNILIAAMPKSASSFLTEMICSTFLYRQAFLVPVHAGREQELDFQKLETYRNLYSFNIDRRNYVAQHHVKYNYGTQYACRHYNLFPVVLVRNVLDNLRSFIEFSREVYDPNVPEYEKPFPSFLSGGPEKNIKDYTIHFHLPWIISFLKSWSYCRTKHIRVSYDILVNDEGPVLKAIMQVCAKSKFESYKDDKAFYEEVQKIRDVKIKEKKSIRFNKGISGRGRSDYFSGEQIEAINNICSISVDKKTYEDWPVWDGLSFTPR